MTGYARIEGLLEERRCVLELKTVNHRFCDINLKMSKNLSSLEIQVRKYLSTKISRGRVDMTIQWENDAEMEAHLVLNTAIAREYHRMLTMLKDELTLPDEITLNHLLTLRDSIISIEKAEAVVTNWETLQTLVDQAVADLDSMREIEGEALKKDLTGRVERLREIIGEIESAANGMAESIREKLTNRFQQLENAPPVDESRLLSEVFFLAERADITEELVRTASHLQHVQTLLDTPGSIGRKLDFIIQELNRELNTIASKSNDAFISQAVVEGKSELEKMREQVQNVE